MSRLNIAIWNCGLIAKPLVQFIEIIKNREVNISVICSTSYEQKFITEKLTGQVEEVTSISDVYEQFWEERGKKDASQILHRAKLNEEKYHTSIIEMLKTDRHMGRAFVKGGWYPRSLFSKELDYIDYIDITNRALAFFEDFFSRQEINVLHLEVASLNTKAACVVAWSQGIKIRIPHPTRIESSYFFSKNEFIEYPYLDEDYKYYLDKSKMEVEDIELQSEESYQLAITEISNYLEYRSLSVTIKIMIRQILVHIYKKIIGNKQYSPYYIGDKLKAVWKYHRGIKIADRQRYPQLDQYTTKKYVFYPIQLEPESATMVMTPEFDSQLHLVHLIASNLPVDWTLIIKEHPLALGTRPVGFIEGIGSYPNVKLVNPFDSAKTWFMNSQAVAMINGTVGYEAAFEGIPVLSFGKHNFISMLEYVFEVDSYETVKACIYKISTNKVPDRKNRKRQGVALEKALKKNSFPLNAGVFYKNDGRVDSQEMKMFSDQFFKSLL